MEFPTLFAKSKSGNVKQWNISVRTFENYSEIVTVYGGKDHVKMESINRIDRGKNIGRSNETSHVQQAILEAQSKYKKKLDQLYLPENLESQNPNTENTKTSETVKNDNVETNPLPMLAMDYFKQKHKVKYPCFVQHKLDGTRGVYNTTTKKITTRTGKDYPIIKESGKLFKELNSLPAGYILDGEFYTNKFSFETLGVLRKTKNLNKEELENLKKIDYHIYDIIDTKSTFEKRNKVLQELLLNKYEKLIYTPTYSVDSEDDLKTWYTKFISDSMEGMMIRNKNSLYKVQHRSCDLLKYKQFNDAEFPIFDFTFEKDTSGKSENLIVWIILIKENCPKGTDCKRNQELCKHCCNKVQAKGTREERQELYKRCMNDFSEFKGRSLWTQFFGYTENNLLRFPKTYRTTYTEYLRDIVM